MEDRCDLVDATLVFRAGVARADYHARLFSELSSLTSRLGIAGRSVQTRNMRSVKMLLAREAARDAAHRRAVRSSVEWESSSFSAS